MAAIIPAVRVNGNAPRPDGSEANSTFALSASVALTLASAVGIFSLRWEVTSAPDGATAALGSATPLAPFNTTYGPLDVTGTYLLKAIANEDPDSVYEFAVCVKTATLLMRKPAVGEDTQWDAERQYQPAISHVIDQVETLGGGGSTRAVVNRTTNGTLVGTKYAIPSARWLMLNLEIPLASGGDLTFYAQLPAAPTEGDIVDVKCLMEVAANEWSAFLNIDGNGKTIEIPLGPWDHAGAIGTLFAATFAPSGNKRNAHHRLQYVGGKWRVASTYGHESASHIHGKWIDLSNGGGADNSEPGDTIAVTTSDEFIPYSLIKGRVSKGQTTFDGDFPGAYDTSNSYTKDGHVYGKTTNGTTATLCSIASLPPNSRVDVLATFNAINVAAADENDTFGVDCRAKFYIDGAGVVTQKGTTVQANMDNDVSGSWDATIDNTAGGAPRLRVTGQLATNIQWDAEVTIMVRTIVDGP